MSLASRKKEEIRPSRHEHMLFKEKFPYPCQEILYFQASPRARLSNKGHFRYVSNLG